MEIFFWSIGATLVVSLISFVGVVGLFFKEKFLDKILLLMVGLSAGSLLGGALLHLLPEAVEGGNSETVFLWALVGFSVFFLIERTLHWHHHHRQDSCKECSKQTLPYMNLIGDGLHNFIDGLIIVAAFLVDVHLGIATTIAVITHEIPQEISDFGVLVYGGFSKTKALLWNFISAVFAIVGATLGFFFLRNFENFNFILLAITAGGFIYIAASDLIPEINKEKGLRKSILPFLFFLMGVGFMYVVKMIFEG